MKYCPHCRRPTARNEGSCPHCGKDLSGSLKAAQAVALDRVATTPKTPSSVPPHLPTGGSGLELDTDWVTKIRDPLIDETRLPERLVPTTLGDTTGFGKPKPGIWGSFAYWIRVRKRLREAASELSTAKELSVRMQDASTHAAASLGKSAYDLKIPSGSLERLAEAAIALEADLDRQASDRARARALHEARIQSLLESKRTVEIEAAPRREAAREAAERMKQLETKKRGLETTRKRNQIDLTNTESLLAAKRERATVGHAAPLQDIATLETRLGTISLTLETLDRELAALAEPMESAAEALDRARFALSPFEEKAASITAQVDEENIAYQAGDAQEAAALSENEKTILSAWAEVGLRVLSENIRHKALEEKKLDTAEALRSAKAAAETVETLEAISQSYDQSVVRAAKRNAILIIGALLTIIAAILVI